MTPEEHTARHVELQMALDELVADFIAHSPAYSLCLQHTILELMAWSQQQMRWADKPPPFFHRPAAGRERDAPQDSTEGPDS